MSSISAKILVEIVSACISSTGVVVVVEEGGAAVADAADAARGRFICTVRNISLRLLEERSYYSSQWVSTILPGPLREILDRTYLDRDGTNEANDISLPSCTGFMGIGFSGIVILCGTLLLQERLHGEVNDMGQTPIRNVMSTTFMQAKCDTPYLIRLSSKSHSFPVSFLMSRANSFNIVSLFVALSQVTHPILMKHQY